MNNNVDKQYLKFIEHILDNGVVKSDRTGTGTISVFDYSMRFNMDEGFPLLTSKKMFTKAVIIELIWFLNGDTNIKYLIDNGCNIWNGDAYKNYERQERESYNKFANNPVLDVQPLELLSKEQFVEKIKIDNDFAKRWGELGPIYGKQWRNWTSENEQVDQIKDLIDSLKLNPDSRRLIVSAWNVGDIDLMVLPPCHYGFQCYTTEMPFEERVQRWIKSIDKDIPYAKDITPEKLDELNFPKRKLDLKWTQRSCDVPLGIPFNIASYAFLLHLLAREVNMIPHELIFSGGDCHIYLNQIDGIKSQLNNETFILPKLELYNSSIFDVKYEDFKIVNYQSCDSINLPLSN